MTKETSVADILGDIQDELEKLACLRERVITIPIPADCGELHLMTIMQENEQ